jgi:hypothetical protein
MRAATLRSAVRASAPLETGCILRQLRETYGMRMASHAQRATPERPGQCQELSIQDVIGRLAAADYHISSQAYDAVEAGRALPHDSAAFAAAIAISLELTLQQRELLGCVLAFDVLRVEAGERFAVLVLIARLLDGRSK